MTKEHQIEESFIAKLSDLKYTYRPDIRDKVKRNIEKLEEKHFIKEEMPKETYDRFLAKYMADLANLQKEIDGCGIYISNLKEMLNEASLLCRNLRKIWVEGSISLKEKLQNLIFPNGLVYDKKKGAFRTLELNEIIAEIARHTGDFAIIKKGLSSLFEPKSLSAERTLPISNLRPLNELAISRLEKAISPHKIQGLKDERMVDLFLRDLTAINDFLFYVEAEPFVTPEKAENRKRVAFKKVDASL